MEITKTNAELRSNRGWECLRLIFLESFKYKDQHLCKIEIEFSSKFWETKKAYSGELNSAELVEDALVKLPQMLISVDELKKLHNLLNDWHKLPLEKLKSTKLLLNAELGVQEGQQLHFEFDHREDFVDTKPEKPVFTLYYDTYSIGGQAAFLVDHSCIGIFIDGLKMLIDECNIG